MTTHRTGVSTARPLDVLGISETEESAYRWLLINPGASAQDLAQALPLSPRKSQHLLDEIEAKGLVTRTPERPRRYIPTSPDIAIESLALQRQQAVQRAQDMIPELQEQAKNRRPNQQEQLVELITNRKVERHTIEQMSRTARHEVVALVRPPILISRLDLPAEEDNYTQREAHARGVHSRSIVDTQFLALPGAVSRMRSNIGAGEEIRMLSSLPFKMVITDRRLALIPLNLKQSSSPVLLIRSSALLDALYALFEILWERATPISFGRSGELEEPAKASQPPGKIDDLLLLMATGLNDKTIAYELGWSPRTLHRRIFELMKSLDARTRFQAGWAAALRQSHTQDDPPHESDS